MNILLQQLRDLVDPVKMREENLAWARDYAAKNPNLEMPYPREAWAASRAALIPIIEQMEREAREPKRCVASGAVNHISYMEKA